VSAVAVFVLIAPCFSANVASARGGKAPTSYNLYFGDLHSHTSYSDGWEGTPWDAYAAAEAAGADYMAVTDHIGFWSAYSAFTITQDQWNDTLAAAAHYTSKYFAALTGYETWLQGGCGEVNVYNVPAYPPQGSLGNKWDRPTAFYDWLAQQPGAVGQFNHPEYMTRDFEDFAYLTPQRDAAMGVLEVFNAKLYEDSYVLALDKGWHVMPSANSDTHSPNWISGYDERTVLMAEKLTPYDLYAAMRAGRGYATLDKNLRISYTLNGEVMGSTLAQMAQTYTAAIHIEDPDGVPSDAITLVEVVSDGGAVVASVPTHGMTVDLTIPLASIGAHYYYIRISTASGIDGAPGATAWTAPVWTGR